MLFEVTLQFPLMVNDESEAIGFNYNHKVTADTPELALLHVLSLKALQVGDGVFVVPQNATMYYVNAVDDETAKPEGKGNGAGEKSQDSEEVSGKGDCGIAYRTVSGGRAQEVDAVAEPGEQESAGSNGGTTSEGLVQVHKESVPGVEDGTQTQKDSVEEET